MSSADDPDHPAASFRDRPEPAQNPSDTEPEAIPGTEPEAASGTESTSIIRRAPTGPIPEPLSDDTRTSILRRAPLPDGDTSAAPGGTFLTDEPATRIIAGAQRSERDSARPAPRRIVGTPKTPPNTTAVAASAVSIVNGWATAVVATDLVMAWWRTDRLYCVGLGFLTIVFGAATIAGVVGLLMRRRVGIYLTLVAAVLALLIFVGIFVAGAHLAGAVSVFPVLPVAAIALALAKPTWRWTRPD